MHIVCNKRLSALMLVAGIILAAGLMFGEEAASVRLSGLILNGAGRPVAGAVVGLRGEGSAWSLSTISAHDGEFSFPDVPSGPCLIVVDKAGYGHLEKSLEAAPDPACPVEIVLRTRTGATGSLGPADPSGLGTKSVALGAKTGSPSAFNPALSVIAGGDLHYDGRHGDGADLLGRADGFSNPLEGEAQGFSLGETELAFSGSVDPYFDAWAVMSVSDERIEVEEAYVQTRRLPLGLQIRAGKFKSGIGYINKQHAHQWDFVDQALPYTMMFGGCLGETGLQVGWLAPLPFYLFVGAEVFQGGNGGVSSYIGPDDDHPYYNRKPGPRLFTGFIKISPDLGYNCALQGGLFVGHSLLHQEDFTRAAGDGVTIDEGLQGTVTFCGTDLVFKYDAPPSYGLGDLTVQAEYIYRRKDLDVAAAGDGPTVPDPGTTPRRFDQDGMYVQAVYGFARRWTGGVRCDLVGLTNRADLSGFGRLDYGTIARWSTDVTMNLTEFSRLRLQYNRLSLSVEGARERFGEIYIQYQISLGAHGAHKF